MTKARDIANITLPAQAALVSGTNIKTIGGQSILGSGDLTVGGIPNVVRSARTSNTILGAADKGTLIDVTSGTFTQTFTAAATLGAGWWCYVGNSGSGFVTLDPNASETITVNGNALSTWVLWPREMGMLVCNGTGFYYYCIQKGEITQTVSSSVASVSFATGLTYRRKLAFSWTNVDLSSDDQIKLFLNTSTTPDNTSFIRYLSSVSGGTGVGDNFTLSDNVAGTPPADSFRMSGSGVFSLDSGWTEFFGNSWYYNTTPSRAWGVLHCQWASISETSISNITIKPNTANIAAGTFILREL